MFKFPLRGITTVHKTLPLRPKTDVRLPVNRLARLQCYSSGRGDDDDDKGQKGNGGITGDDKLYLHVGPSGDCWTGTSIFAAKHLQPDYVKSLVLPKDTDISSLLEQLEADPSVAQTIYDEEKIPPSLLTSNTFQVEPSSPTGQQS